MDDFKNLLARAGITKAELARRLNVDPRTVSSWQSSPPGYATAYLLLLIEYNRLLP